MYDAHIKPVRIVVMAKGSKFYVGISRELLLDP
jgi:hypothetical protein